MIPSRILCLFVAICPPAVLFAQQRQVIDISQRDDCYAAEYRDPAYTLEGLLDTTALRRALSSFQKPPEDALSAMIRLLPSGKVLNVDVAANRHTPAERAALAKQIGQMILPQVVPADTTPVMLAVGPEMEPTISLWHGAYTCQVAVLNEEEIKESFGRAVQALRRQNAIRSRAHGRVVIQYVVGTTGVLDRVTVTSSSGWAEADSAAVRALRVGEFLPQVQGKYAVPAAVQTPFNF